jgi:hypothetical protein
MSSEKKKTKKAKPKTKKSEPPKLIEDDSFTLVMSRDELVSSMQMISFTKGIFEQMAITAEKEKDDKSVTTWVARIKLAQLLYKKLNDIMKIGEPTSREVH